MWFISHEEIWIFVRYVISPFHPSFVYIYIYTSALTIKKECGIQCSLCSVSLLSVKIWMEGSYDMTFLIKSLFLHDYWTKSDGVFAEMQIISYYFIILKHIQINSQCRKIMMLKVRLSSSSSSSSFFFFGGGGQSVYICTAAASKIHGGDCALIGSKIAPRNLELPIMRGDSWENGPPIMRK